MAGFMVDEAGGREKLSAYVGCWLFCGGLLFAGGLLSWVILPKPHGISSWVPTGRTGEKGAPVADEKGPIPGKQLEPELSSGGSGAS